MKTSKTGVETVKIVHMMEFFLSLLSFLITDSFQTAKDTHSHTNTHTVLYL